MGRGATVRAFFGERTALEALIYFAISRFFFTSLDLPVLLQEYTTLIRIIISLVPVPCISPVLLSPNLDQCRLRT